MADRFGYWPEGAAYKTPQPEPVLAPICTACGSRHRGAVAWCALTNEEIPDDDTTD